LASVAGEWASASSAFFGEVGGVWAKASAVSRKRVSLASPMSKGLDVARLAVLLGGEEAKGEVWSLKLGGC